MGKRGIRRGDRAGRRGQGDEAQDPAVEVAEQITDETDLAGRHVGASADESQHSVVSQRTHEEAERKPAAQHRKG